MDYNLYFYLYNQCERISVKHSSYTVRSSCIRTFTPNTAELLYSKAALHGITKPSDNKQ